MKKLYSTLPTGYIALVSGPFIKGEKIINGPARISKWNTIRLFQRQVLIDGETGYYYDENGDDVRIDGPDVVQIHPDGSFKPNHRFQLGKNEAIVVINRAGQRVIYTGDVTPEVIVGPYDKVHEFKWTGTGPNQGEDKIPGALKLTKLRLQDTQAYQTITVRTSDNCVLTLKLMIYWKINNLDLLVNFSDDPLGSMFNKIKAELTDHIGNIPFDTFKSNAANTIRNHPIFKDEQANQYFKNYGLLVRECILREWKPTDDQVQKVLEKAAVVETQRTLQKAQHALVMEEIDNKQKQMAKQKELEKLEIESSNHEGKTIAEKYNRLYDELCAKMGPETAKRLLELEFATKAGTLVLGTDYLGK